MFLLSFVATFFQECWHKILIVVLSCVPIIESRYAIVIGQTVFKNIGTLELFLLTQLGAFATTIILLLLLRPVINWMKKTKLFSGLAQKIEERGKRKGEKLDKKLSDANSKAKKVVASVISVFLFVAIPLPGTGVWTGSLVATILDIRFKYAFPAICIGSVCATLIMLAFGSVFLQTPQWLQMFM